MVLSICNEKGGSGKTSIAINLAITLAKYGKVLLIDADQQKSIGVFMRLRERMSGSEGFENTLTDFDYIDGYDSLIKIDINKAKSIYDYIVIDTGGRDSAEMRYAMVISDFTIIPTCPSSELDADTVKRVCFIFDEARNTKEANDPKAIILISRASTNLFTKAKLDAYTSFVESNLNDNVVMAETIIYEREIYKSSISNGIGVVEATDVRHKAYSEIVGLAEEIIGFAKKIKE